MGMMRFKDKVILVTGGAFGIGKNISVAFAKEGANVFVVDKNRKAGEALIENSLNMTFLNMDLTVRNAQEKMMSTVLKKTGRLDVLVNNASLGIKKSFQDEKQKEWDQAMAINLKVPYILSQAAIAAMAKTGGGVIMNIASVAAQWTCHQSPSYHMAKAGLVQMTKYLATYAGPLAVRVNAVSPGFIVRDEDRDRFYGQDNEAYRRTAYRCHPLKDVGTADDVANAVLFLCSGQARFITGQNLVVDGGLTLQEPSGLVFEVVNSQKKRDR